MVIKEKSEGLTKRRKVSRIENRGKMGSTILLWTLVVVLDLGRREIIDARWHFTGLRG